MRKGGPMRAIWLVCLAGAAIQGCGRTQKETSDAHYPFLVSGPEAERIASDMVRRVRTLMEKGDMEGYHKLCCLRRRQENTVQHLRENYDKNPEENRLRARTTQLLRVFPPGRSDPFIDLAVSHGDQDKEFWRLVYEEGEWRVAGMGRKIADLGYN